MGFNINTPGPTSILNSSSTGPGNWYRIHGKMGKMTFQVLHTGSSVGATVQSTIYVQASNDGVNPLQTTAGTTVDALATVVLNGGSPQSAGFALDANWGWVRAFTNALSTGSIQVNVAGQQRS